MNFKRVVLGSNPGLTKIRNIPDICQREKTIHLNEMRVISIFRDYRPSAKEWINEMLPQFIVGVSPEKIRQVFWDMPPNGWYEFNCATKTLSFCYVEKK
jgi:hypothetical protein